MWTLALTRDELGLFWEVWLWKEAAVAQKKMGFFFG